MNKSVIIAGSLIAAGVALFMSPFASSSPDGLERVAEDKGFIEATEGKGVLKSPIPDYVFPGVKNERVATAAAGLVGTGITLAVALGIGAVLKKNR